MGDDSQEGIGRAPSRTVKRGAEKHLQDILWPETLFAVRRSLSCQSVAELGDALRSELPQNSANTRSRNTSVILSRFFPTADLDTFPRRVAATYDDDVLAHVLGPLLLLAEPLLGRLFAERLHPIDAGAELPRDFFRRYGEEVGGTTAVKVGKRSSGAASALGWTIRERARTFRAATTVDRTAALLLLHHHYAPSPCIVDVNRVIAEPVWKYLAFADADELRAFLRDLERKGLVSRYSQVDRLEQVTTRYSLEELLSRGVRA